MIGAQSLRTENGVTFETYVRDYADAKIGQLHSTKEIIG